jgi:hypothetical protein
MAATLLHPNDNIPGQCRGTSKKQEWKWIAHRKYLAAFVDGSETGRKWIV